MDMDIMKTLARAQGKTIEQVQASLIEAQVAEIRGEKLSLPTKHDYQRKQEIQAQLPMWGEPVRGVPNSVLRSALFTATKRGKRQYCEQKKIASVDGISVVFTGPRLDQADLDVWEQCLHIARNHGLGNTIQFTVHSFLKSIGRNTGNSQHEWLKGAFARLRTSDVEISDGKRTFFGALISSGQRNEETSFYELVLNPRIASLYNDDGWTGEDWEQRKQLIGKPLALWLHGFYSSHSKPFDYKIETLHKLCGSQTKQLFHFKAEFKEAITHLSEATGWNCRIEGDKLQVFKTPEQLIKRLAK
jgi:hypothetical protein